MPYAINDQGHPGQSWGGFERQLRIGEEILQGFANDTLRINHPEQYERPDQWGDDHGQEGHKDRWPFQDRSDSVHAQGDRKSEQNDQRCDNEGIDQSKANRFIQWQIVKIGEEPPQ